MNTESAFPNPEIVEDIPNGSRVWAAQPGMTLRDYFAAKAMAAIIAKLPTVDQEGEFGRPVDDKVQHNLDIATSAYFIADAMLAARKS